MSKALYPSFDRQVPNAQARYDLLRQLFNTAVRMNEFGIRVDRERARQHIADAEARRDRFKALFLELTGLPEGALGAAGTGQTNATRDWFWITQGAPALVFDKHSKKPQFNTPTLVGYATDFADKPFGRPAAALFGLRKAITSARFAKAYLEVSGAFGGRVHFSFNPLGTKGERWSSAGQFRWKDENGVIHEYGLNAQNVPSKEPEYNFGSGPEKLAISLRDCFIPDPGCVWIKWDYEGAEARLIAYVTGARKLIEWIESGTDLHIANARGIFLEAKIPEGASKKDPLVAKCREAAKPLMYALSYSVTNEKGESHVAEVFKQIKQIFPDAQEVYVKELARRFFRLHPEILAWHREIRHSVQHTGTVTLPQTGAQLYLPNTMRGYNQAANFFMQSGLGAIINAATPAVDRLCDWTPGGLAVLALVHDEIDMQVPEGRAAEIELKVSELMGQPMNFGGVEASIPAKGAVGSNWKNGKDIR